MPNGRACHFGKQFHTIPDPAGIFRSGFTGTILKHLPRDTGSGPQNGRLKNNTGRFHVERSFPWDYNGRIAGVAQWQSRSFPSLRRGFDSRPPLHIFFRLLSFPFAYLKKISNLQHFCHKILSCSFAFFRANSHQIINKLKTFFVI